jgi:hypothetical protein
MAPAPVDECGERGTIHRVRKTLDLGVSLRMKLRRVAFADTAIVSSFRLSQTSSAFSDA